MQPVPLLCDLKVAVGNFCAIFGAAFSRPDHWMELGGGSFRGFLWVNLLEGTGACQGPPLCSGTQQPDLGPHPESGSSIHRRRLCASKCEAWTLEPGQLQEVKARRPPLLTLLCQPPTRFSNRGYKLSDIMILGESVERYKKKYTNK